MCGIAGIIGNIPSGVIERLIAEMSHRGPDGTGFSANGNARIGSCRLSIVDVSGGEQPFYSEDGRLSSVVNGEIYNYRELREELSASGHTLRSASDAEVVVHLYEEYGEDCVSKLRGMFALAVSSPDGVFLARDRLGIKPLYLYELPNARGLAFASEIRALLRAGCDAALDETSLAESVSIGYALGSRTLFRSIRELPPGETLTVSVVRGEIVKRSRRYYERKPQGLSGLTFHEAVRSLREKIEKTVASHFIGEYPMAICLSGGLDSTILAADASLHGELTAFTVSDRADHPDVLVAKNVASHLGIRHEFLLMTQRDAFANIVPFVEAAHTIPSVHSLPSLLLSRRIASVTKVCLDGEGADEVFGGYLHHMQPSRNVASLESSIRSCVEIGLPISEGLLEAVEIYRYDNGERDNGARVLDFEQRSALVKQHFDPLDRLGMECSLEYRVPFMDHELFELGNSLPITYRLNRSLGIGKFVLRAVALDMLGSAGLEPVLRLKHGFPSSGAGFARRFDDAVEQVMPADYHPKHDLGKAFRSTGKLVLFDLFLDSLSDGADSRVAPMREFLAETSRSSDASIARHQVMKASV